MTRIYRKTRTPKGAPGHHIVILLAVMLAAFSGAARASWMWVPPEVLIEDAEYVVSGEMAQVNAQAGTGTIKVSDVLKGPDRTVKAIPVSFSAQGGLMLSTAIFFEDGQKGIWIMSRKDAAGRYALNGHPGQHMPPEKLADVVYMIRKMEAAPWGKPVNGIAIRTLIVPGMPHQGGWNIYIGVKNVSRKPLQVPEHVAHGALQIKITDPSGDEKPLLYPVPMIMLGPGQGFKELAPGAVFHAQPGGLQLQNVKTVGAYKVNATFSGAAAGDTWRGTAVAPEAVLHYGLTASATTGAESYAPNEDIDAALSLKNVTDTNYSLFDVAFSGGWQWEFVAVGGDPVYRGLLLVEYKRAPGEYVFVKAGETAQVAVQLPTKSCKFQRVYPPGTPVAAAAVREIPALPPGRYVAILRRTLVVPDVNRRRGMLIWAGEVEAHTGVIEITDPKAVPPTKDALRDKYRIPAPLGPDQLDITRHR